MPNKPTNLRFDHLLEEHKLAAQILDTVNALLSFKEFFSARGHGGRRHADFRA